jgi:hypothetical protein
MWVAVLAKSQVFLCLHRSFGLFFDCSVRIRTSIRFGAYERRTVDPIAIGELSENLP